MRDGDPVAWDAGPATWGTIPPPLGAGLAEDATALARYAAAADRELATLPAAPQRDRRQRDAAARILRAARTLRDRFIAQHAEAVYDELTGACSVHLRIDALARAAADRFPGLVPTRA
ncbi:hypothetical protein [Streptomyces sp. NPDC056244]|uniref:hypothetical protein n=1 Tax=Streptomyces sp. NPDC056244 TaxID=3345762 RepID=UPI0035D910B4